MAASFAKHGLCGSQTWDGQESIQGLQNWLRSTFLFLQLWFQLSLYVRFILFLFKRLLPYTMGVYVCFIWERVGTDSFWHTSAFLPAKWPGKKLGTSLPTLLFNNNLREITESLRLTTSYTKHYDCLSEQTPFYKSVESERSCSLKGIALLYQNKGEGTLDI